jgi:hypothetical protein
MYSLDINTQDQFVTLKGISCSVIFHSFLQQTVWEGTVLHFHEGGALKF